MSVFYPIDKIADLQKQDGMPYLVDNHAHINMHPKPCAALVNFYSNKGLQVLDVSTNFNEFKKSLDLNNCHKITYINSQKQNNKNIASIPTILHAHAIHPEYLYPNALAMFNNRIEPELRDAIILTQQKSNSKYIIDYATKILEQNKKSISVIGEFGLDTFKVAQDAIKNTLNLQIDLFLAYLELANKFNKPIMLHIRGKMQDYSLYTQAFNLIKDFTQQHSIPAVYFHSITAPWQYITAIVEAGYYIGINGIATYSSAQYLRQVIKNTPNSQILPETDAPFLIPSGVKTKYFIDKKHNEPLGVQGVIKFIEKIKENNQIA